MHAIQETSTCSAVHYRVVDLFRGDKELIDAVSRRTPWSRPRTIKLDLRGPHEWTLARLGTVWDSGRCYPLHPRREARAGWPSLLALKPGERSRDRVRLTICGRSTASERRPSATN